MYVLSELRSAPDHSKSLEFHSTLPHLTHKFWSSQLASVYVKMELHSRPDNIVLK